MKATKYVVGGGACAAILGIAWFEHRKLKLNAAKLEIERLMNLDESNVAPGQKLPRPATIDALAGVVVRNNRQEIIDQAGLVAVRNYSALAAWLMALAK